MHHAGGAPSLLLLLYYYYMPFNESKDTRWRLGVQSLPPPNRRDTKHGASTSTDLAVLPLGQRVQQTNSRTSASSCWCGRRRGGRDPRCWPAASATSRYWAQPRGPAGSDAPPCVQGARFRVARGLLGPRLALLRGHARQQ
jgi:hypothetical protein